MKRGETSARRHRRSLRLHAAIIATAGSFASASAAFTQQRSSTATATAGTSLIGESAGREASPPTAITAFVSRARAGSERYRNRDAAIEQGFRRLGMDFPSMGEHWVNPGKVFAARFDPADPAMLTYATIRGKVELVGVVYAVPLAPGEEPPTLPDGVNRWHEHNGTVEEESMLPEHHSHHAAPGRMRLAILHLWLEAPNPAGMFAADNWSLPFLKLGLQPPADPRQHESAARALSLLTGGDKFFLNVMRDATSTGQLEVSQQVAMKDAVLAVSLVVPETSSARSLTEAQLVALGSIWDRFARESRLLVTPAQR